LGGYIPLIFFEYYELGAVIVVMLNRLVPRLHSLAVGNFSPFSPEVPSPFFLKKLFPDALIEIDFELSAYLVIFCPFPGDIGASRFLRLAFV